MRYCVTNIEQNILLCKFYTRKDKKKFKLPRRFSQNKCKKGPIKGFTMKASCAPYKYCKRKSYKKN